MKIQTFHLQNFKRFKDLHIKNIPLNAQLVLLIGANGSGKSALFDAS
jgi:AAA15 family ATPase/GTPase